MSPRPDRTDRDGNATRSPNRGARKAVPLDRPDTNDLPDYDRFYRWLKAVGSCSERTARSYAARARLAVDWFTTDRPGIPLVEISSDDVEEYIMELDERGLSSSSRRGSVYALRKLYAYLGRRDTNAPNPAKAVPAPTQYSTRPLPYGADELARLLAAPLAEAARHEPGSPDWVRARFDHAVLATFRYAGPRSKELIDFETLHVRPQVRQLEVRRGEGAKQRFIPIPQQLADILDAYLTEVRPYCPDSKYLFANPDGQEGSAVYGSIAPRAVFALVAKWAEKAELATPAFPHKLRHSYATDMYEKGVQLNAISALLGHRSILTTVRYIGLSFTSLSRAVDKAFPDLGATYEQLQPRPARDDAGEDTDGGGEGVAA